MQKMASLEARAGYLQLDRVFQQYLHKSLLRPETLAPKAPSSKSTCYGCVLTWRR